MHYYCCFRKARGLGFRSKLCCCLTLVSMVQLFWQTLLLCSPPQLLTALPLGLMPMNLWVWGLLEFSRRIANIRLVMRAFDRLLMLMIAFHRSLMKVSQWLLLSKFVANPIMIPFALRLFCMSSDWHIAIRPSRCWANLLCLQASSFIILTYRFWFAFQRICPWIQKRTQNYCWSFSTFRCAGTCCCSFSFLLASIT